MIEVLSELQVRAIFNLVNFLEEYTIVLVYKQSS